MTMPPMGKIKTRTDHRSLWLTGRDDLRTSTRWNVSVLRARWGFGKATRLTPDEDIEHKDDEADDSAAGAVLSGGVLGGDGRGGAEGC
jgi:hypothetical protein